MRSHRSYSDSTLSTFTAGDGENLAIQYWPVAEGRLRRGVVVLVHGLGEHAGRYERLAQWLTDRGFTVYGYDQCGHGESSGARGCLPATMRLIEDLTDVVESARRRMRPGEPLIVLGHSMGAVVAGCVVTLRKVPIDGLVLSSPAFAPRLNALQRLLLALLPRLLPNLTVRNGVRPESLTHDPDAVSAWRDDPLVHQRISARLAYFITEAGPRLVARARRWPLPTLLLYSGSDAVVNPAGSRRFAEAAPRGMVTAQCFPDLYHEIFNELDSEPVFEALQDWLDERFPAPRDVLRRGALPQAHAGEAPASPAPPHMRPRAPVNPS